LESHIIAYAQLVYSLLDMYFEDFGYANSLRR
jgi:hypothetical protein